MRYADMDVAESPLELIGHTPMVRLSAVGGDLKCDFIAKLETTNPGGSSKDRPALTMVLAAEQEGLLGPGSTIIEPTSGNTGVGLAIVAAHRGYKCIFVMSDKMAPEKIDVLRAYGAEVVVCPTAVAPEHPDSYYSTAERLTKETPNGFRPDQYSNPNNPRAHYETTGPEIWEQTKGRVTHFVAGAGTGGTISGVGKYLKEKNPNIKIIAADPQGSVFSGGAGRPYLTEGVGEDFWPENYDPSLVDEVVAVSDADAFAMAREVTRREGILIGGSGGTAVAAALRVARSLPEEAVVVVLIPDSGRGYLSKIFNDTWMTDFGFLRPRDEMDAGDVLAAKIARQNSTLADLVLVTEDVLVRDAISLMREKDVSQLLVTTTAELPLAAKEVSGSLSELGLLEATTRDASVLDLRVKEVADPSMPMVGVGMTITELTRHLSTTAGVLVLDGGHPVGVLTRSDLLGFLEQRSDA
ncbi:MAG TPA: cystathionine beta-synthase [Acidimicrobiales bacterium]|jgi:cystathionine beta-synthase|nr:cystathionine beta-synthase [Acidimicrobiales bacterium]